MVEITQKIRMFFLIGTDKSLYFYKISLILLFIIESFIYFTVQFNKIFF